MKKNLVICSLLAFFAALSCSPDNQLNPPQVAPETGGAVASIESFTLSPTGGVWTVAFTGNAAWDLTMSNDGSKWLNVNKKSGRAGTTTLVFSANVNPERKDRSTQVQFRAKDGSFVESITVSQPYPYLRLYRDSSSEMKPQLSEEGNDFGFTWDRYEKSQMNRTPATIRVESNVAWQVVRMGGGANDLLDTSRVHNGVHFGVSKLQGVLEKGVGDGEINLLPYTQNIDKEPYEVSFQVIPVYEPTPDGTYEDIRKIKVEGAEKSVDGYSVSLNQNFLRFLIDDKADNLAQVTMSEMNEMITMHINSEVAWKVTDIPGDAPMASWVKFVEPQGNAGDDVLLRFDASGVQSNGVNPERAKRTTRFRLAAKAAKGEVGYGAYRDIEVTQKAYVLEWQGDMGAQMSESHHYLNDDATTCEYIVKSSSDNWQLSNVPDWLDYTRGARNPLDSLTTISFYLKEKVGQNLELNTIQSSGTGVVTNDNNLRLDLSFSQDPFVFDFSINEASDGKNLTVKTMDRTNHATKLQITGDWRLENDAADWLELLLDGNAVSNGERGTFDLFTHPLYGNDNLDKSRKGTLKLVSVNHEKRGKTLTREISLTQSRFEFELKNAKYFGTTLPSYASSFVTPSFTVACSVPWTLSVTSTDSMDWLTPSIDSYNGALLEKEVSFTPVVHSSENGVRIATVTITPDVSGLNRAVEPKSVTISQAAFSFDESALSFSDLSEIDVADFSFTFDNADMAPVSINAPDWVNCNKSDANGKTTLSVSVQNNLSTEPTRREGQIIVTSLVNNEKKTIDLSQGYFKFDSTPLSLDYDEISQGAQIVPITCSGAWEVDSNGYNWVKLTKQNNQVSVNADVNVNTSASGRKGTVYVYSVLHKQSGQSLRKAITVNQKPYVFDISATDLTAFESRPAVSRSINVNSSGKWVLKQKNGSSVVAWAGVSSTAGNGLLGGGNETVSVKPENQNDTIPRSVVLRLESEYVNLNSALYKEFTLSQNPFIFKLSKKDVAYSGPVHQAPTSINVTCMDSWSVESKPSWITINELDGTEGNGTFTFTPENNLSETARKNEFITIKSVTTGHKLNVKLTQPGFVHQVSKSELNFQPVGNSAQSFQISSSDAWTISGLESWLHISSDSGNGNATISVTVDNNTSVSETHSASLVITSSMSNLKKTVSVKQAAFVWNVGGEDLNLEPLDVVSRTINVQSSSAWSVSSSNSAVVSVEKGSNNFKLIPAKNLTAEPRSATVTITSGYGHSKVINITKKPFVWSVTGPASISLTTPIETPSYQWTVSCSSDWECSLTGSNILTLTKSGNTISAKVNSNTATSNKSATLRIQSKEGGYFMEVPISQPAFEWSVTGTAAPHFTALSPEVENYWVTCSSGWTVNSNNEQIKVVKNANGFTIEPTENTSLSSRSATITVKSDMGNYQRTITVTQDAFIWSVSGPDTLTLGADESKSQDWTVNCSSDWTYSVTGDDSMLIVSKTANKLSVQVNANEGTVTRTATIKIQSAMGNHEKSVTITQAGLPEVEAE